MNGILVRVDSISRQAESIGRICVMSESKDTTSYDSDDVKPDHTSGGF